MEKGTEKLFFQMKKYMKKEKCEKKCSTSLDTREMQIETILRFHVTTMRLSIIKNTKQMRLARMPGNEASAHSPALSTGAVSMEVSVEVSQKTNVRTVVGSCCRAHGHQPKVIKGRVSRDTCLLLITGKLHTITESWNPARCL